MAPLDPAVQLAQKLAANEKKIRDRAVKKLRAYLRARSLEESGGFTEVEFTKIWKGLFYCLWMQDKPLLQEELSQTISQLIHFLHTRDTQDLFLRTFWQTLSREWNGIDRLRMDKFFTLSRFILRQSIELLKKENWEESLVGEFLSLLVQEVMQDTTPRGVQLHLIDIYLDELAKVGSAELQADLNLRFIEPFCKMAAQTKDPLLLQSILSGIFQTILDQAPYAIEDLMKELNQMSHDQETTNGGPAGDLVTDGSEPDEVQDTDDEDIGPVLQFDYQAVAERLLALASRKTTPAHNRKRLYRLVKQFQDLAEGAFPQDDYPEEVSTDEDDDEFSSWRFRKRQKQLAAKSDALDPSKDVAEPPKRREKKRRCEVTITEGSQEPDTASTPPAKKKHRKKGVGVVKCRTTQDQPAHLAVNGETPQPFTKRKADLDPACATATLSMPANPTQEDTSMPNAYSTPPRTRKLTLKRRRRGGLLRLGLSVIPLRTGGLARRKVLLERYRIKKLKASVLPPQDKMTSAQPECVPHCKKGTPTPVCAKTEKAKGGQKLRITVPQPQDKVTPPQPEFVSFCKKGSPKAVYVKTAKGKGGQVRSRINNKSKKVTFSLNKNMTAEFKRTDRSLLVSPSGSSRVPFNPQQRPQYSVLKTPSPSSVSRPRAADFF
ncbi:ribosomal RNA processing protein 1 homolog B-like [Discoglossus pictus]